jgi:23S rRNA pseudouridine1911/1915/1917 synthase
MSEDTSITIEVPSTLAGVRVDRAVAMVAGVSRTVAAELIAGGKVLVDGVAVTVGRSVLRVGAELTVERPVPGQGGVLAEEGIAFGVVHADTDVAVVDKPAGLVVHPGAGHVKGTLVGGLLDLFPELGELVSAGLCPPDRPGIVHRLDKGTSGLLAVARTAAAYEGLVDQLATRSMRRQYWALVEGDVVDAKGEIDAPIGRSARTPTKMAVSAGGKPARTRYTVLARYAGAEGRGPTTWLELQLESGRTHQIRVHLAAIGHPVVGDVRYGTRDPECTLGAGRFFLHAFGLAFSHPTSGQPMEFSSPLPPDLEAYLAGQAER